MRSEAGFAVSTAVKLDGCVLHRSARQTFLSKRIGFEGRCVCLALSVACALDRIRLRRSARWFVLSRRLADGTRHLRALTRQAGCVSTNSAAPPTSSTMPSNRTCASSKAATQTVTVDRGNHLLNRAVEWKWIKARAVSD